MGGDNNMVAAKKGDTAGDGSAMAEFLRKVLKSNNNAQVKSYATHLRKMLSRYVEYINNIHYLTIYLLSINYS